MTHVDLTHSRQRSRPHRWTRFGEGSGRAGYRFTVKGDTLYAITLTWPGAEATITALAKGKDKAPEGKIERVGLLGHPGPLEFTQDDECLKVKMPAEQPCKYAFALKIDGLTMNPPGPAVPADPTGVGR